jgi:hypothetical protein
MKDNKFAASMMMEHPPMGAVAHGVRASESSAGGAAAPPTSIGALDRLGLPLHDEDHAGAPRFKGGL